jgi:hypothetical protein
MASEVKTNKISPATGTDVTLGDASDTFTIPSGSAITVASGGDINVASGGEIDIASGATLDVNGTIDLTGATQTGLPDNKPAFHVYLTATQSIPNTTFTKIQLETAILDTASGFNLTASGTNPYAYTVSVAGTYLIQTGLSLDNIDDGEYARVTIYKNGVRHMTADTSYYSGTSNQSAQIGKCFMISLAVDDYIELWVYHTEGASQDIEGVRQFLSGFKLLV